MGVSQSKNMRIAAAVVVLGAGAYFLFGGGEDASQQGGFTARVLPVVTASVVKAEFVDSIEAVGTAKSNESIVVSAKVTEKISALNFTDGQFIDKGEIIVELADIEANADLAEARATLAEAQSQFERVEGLFKRGNSTQAALDTARSARDRAAARAEAVEARLSDRLIRAPFSGVLGLRQVSVGTLVRPGDEITTLDDISLMKLDFSVPETFLQVLRPGLEVTARSAAYKDKEFVGTITAIGTRIDPTTRAVMIRAEIPNDKGLLKPGMLMTTRVLQNRRSAMMLPEEAIVPLEERNFVFRVTNGERGQTVEQVFIEIGGRRPGEVEILSGIELGDQIVTEGTNRLRPSSPVKVLNTQTKPNV